MTYSDAVGKGKEIIDKNKWLLLVPLLNDTLILLVKYFRQGVFIDTAKIPGFQIKFSLPTALPSLKNIIDAFPDFINFNTSSGWQNTSLMFSVAAPEPWNKILIFCAVVFFLIISSFLEGAFLGCIAKTHSKGERCSLRDFTYFGAYYWSRFLALKILGGLCIIPVVLFVPLIIVYFILMFPLFYLSYALVWDDLTVAEAISKTFQRFSHQSKNIIGFMAYIALINAILSFFLVPLTRLNVFLGLIPYNALATLFVAGIMVKYSDFPPEDSDSQEAS